MKYFIMLIGNLVLVPLHAQTATQNYVVTTVPNKEVSSPAALSDANSNTTIQYFDGLGRPSQTVQRGITPQKADLVSGIEYDSFGRESRKWLPGAVAGNNGAYVPDFGTPAVQTNGDSSPFATTEYEPSPLNRVTGQYGPGADWYSNSKKKSIDYTTNAANSVKLYTVGSTQLSCSGYYDAATLYGQKTTDEDGKWMEEFTDKLGRKVLSRTYDVSGGNHDTYYVYDDLDNLRYVLPPLAADALGSGSYDNSADALVKYAYLYTYDGRKRCIEKRMPGCDWIHMVYDRADRLILSQDGNQRAKNQWTVNKYDQFSRLLYSGIANNSSSHVTMDSIYSSQIFTESYTGSGPVAGYTSDKITPDVLLTVNYYDNYRFLEYSGNNPEGKLTYVAQDGYTAAFENPPVGELGGFRSYHLDDPTKFEVTALYYDKYGRTVQTRATNHLGGYDITCNEIDFTGKPQKTLKTHGHNGAATEITELYTYSYDHAQRLLTTTHQLNGGNAVILVSNTYDDLGRLKTKNLGGVDATTYNYNVRSWVKDITGSRFTENLYYYNAPGTIAPFSPAYNGNIGAIKWNTPADGINRERIYTFGYDDLNRLKDGTYSELAGSTVVNSNRYTEQFDYDKMGNITNFVRYGLQGTAGGMAYGLIDDLTLTHQGNQLIKVTDNGNDGLYYGNEEFLKNTANSGNSAAYDANGNRLYDSNSNVWAIKYNALNLPDAMQFYQGHQTNYTYSAGGAKLKVVDKTAPEGVTLPVSSLNIILSNPSVASTTTTDYDGNYIYENGSLKRILLPEGYWQNGAYCYYLKDHLGSNRIVVQNDGTVVESSSYYPSGMRFGESVVAVNNSVQPYRHTGHEMQEMHGLNWIDNNARFRSVSDGPTFLGLDPLAEKYYSISPYVYCAENPLKFVDTNGKDIDIWYPTDNGSVAYFRFNGSNGNKAPNSSYVQDFLTAYNYNISNGGGDNLKAAATNDKLLINISPAWTGSVKTDYYSMSENTIHWDSHKALKSVGGLRLSPSTILEHEMDHAIAANKDLQGFIKRVLNTNINGNAEEDRVMSGSERKTGIANGEITKQQRRVDHNNGILYPVNSPTSTTPTYINQHINETINYWMSLNPNIQITIK